MEWFCRYCPSRNARVVWAEDGHPIEIVCEQCGKVLSTDPETLEKIYKEQLRPTYEDCSALTVKEGEAPFIRLEINAEAYGKKVCEVLEVPFRDGEFSLLELNYPMSRFCFLRIENKTLTLGKDSAELSGKKLRAIKNSVAYTPDRVGWPETITVTIDQITKPADQTDKE